MKKNNDEIVVVEKKKFFTDERKQAIKAGGKEIALTAVKAFVWGALVVFGSVAASDVIAKKKEGDR